jgi:hypothetical protein
MPCLSAPSISLPAGLSLLLPSLPTITLPGVPSLLCCTLPAVPTPTIVLPLGLIPGIAVILQPVLAVIMAVIDLLNSLLDLIQVSCPLE